MSRCLPDPNNALIRGREHEVFDTARNDGDRAFLTVKRDVYIVISFTISL